MTAIGKIYLIGAGPGAADLITVRGANLLAKADIVFYDALVTPEILEFCPQAVQVPVGKRCGKLSTAQRFIEKRMIDAAQKYGCIVRLKGGDPMMFGRADEELHALELAGIEVEVVPGVTAALAAAASLQKSLTLRGVSRSVAFVTKARGNDEKNDPINQVLNQCPAEPIDKPQADTLVYYMGRQDAVEIANELIADGKSTDTPVVVIEAISTKAERSISLTLAEMAAGAINHWFLMDAPVLLLVGRALRERDSTYLKRTFGVSDDGLQDVDAFSNSRRCA